MRAACFCWSQFAQTVPLSDLLPRVLQVLDPLFGMYVWPCAVVLAQYLWSQREQLGGLAVLEVRRLQLLDLRPLSLTSCPLSWAQV